ncbi:MAG TPA: hypothetical protein VGO52_22040 [Hyphomonadaceae bacterium]|jgi:hypothetical protein|nr:hypothetical protein [Hyphomonadaceae bacterium]
MGPVLGFFQWLFGISSSEHAADDLSATVAVLGALIAIGAALIAWWQVYKAGQLDREMQARAMYESYLRLCFENSPMSSGIEDANHWTDRYEWFVSIMLNAAESVLLFVSAKDEWEETVKSQIRYHKAYLHSTKFREREFKYYDDRMRDLIEKVCGEANDQPSSPPRALTS